MVQCQAGLFKRPALALPGVAPAGAGQQPAGGQWGGEQGVRRTHAQGGPHGLGGAQGQATDIEIHAREILKTREQLNRILADRTGQPLEKIERDTERDYYLSADESKDYGLVDQVIAKRP